MDWARMLAFVTGTVDQALRARNEYLAAENRIIKAQLKGRLKLTDAERSALGGIGHRLGRKVLTDVATVARPETILGWYHKLIACKFDGSARRGPGRPRIKREVEQLIARMANENRDWGYDRIAGSMDQSSFSILGTSEAPAETAHAAHRFPGTRRNASVRDIQRVHLENIG